MVRHTAVTGQLAFDDCQPDWPVAAGVAVRPRAGTRYHLGPQDDLRGQRLRAIRIVTIPTTGEYL